jgi:hypothetical protein
MRAAVLALAFVEAGDPVVHHDLILERPYHGATWPTHAATSCTPSRPRARLHDARTIC